MTILDISV